MTVASICQREVDLASPSETVRAAAQRMDARNVGTLLVVDEARKPVGILTDRDVAVRAVAAGLDPESTPVREVMTADPATISERAPIEDALAAMRAHSVRRMPVVSPQGALVGIVSIDDLLSHLAEEFWQLGRLLERSSPRGLATA